MKIYLLEHLGKQGYDTYDSCIVAAKNEDEARKISPRGMIIGSEEYDSSYEQEWIAPDEVHLIQVTLLGTAVRGTKKGVLLASFNAG